MRHYELHLESTSRYFWFGLALRDLLDDRDRLVEWFEHQGVFATARRWRTISGMPYTVVCVDTDDPRWDILVPMVLIRTRIINVY